VSEYEELSVRNTNSETRVRLVRFFNLYVFTSLQMSKIHRRTSIPRSLSNYTLQGPHGVKLTEGQQVQLGVPCGLHANPVTNDQSSPEWGRLLLRTELSLLVATFPATAELLVLRTHHSVLGGMSFIGGSRAASFQWPLLTIFNSPRMVAKTYTTEINWLN